MEMYCHFISIYGKFVTPQTASFLRADISITCLHSTCYQMIVTDEVAEETVTSVLDTAAVRCCEVVVVPLLEYQLLG